MTTENYIPFRYCPAGCSGGTTETYDVCPVCNGTGDRVLSKTNLEFAESAKEWIDEQVDNFFSEYCRITGRYKAYGVESWRFDGGNLAMIIDTSCRGCYDTENVYVPLKWFFAVGQERTDLITAWMDEKTRSDADSRMREKLGELARLEQRAAELRGELSSK